MRFRNSPDGYGAVPQALHWLTVTFVLVAWALGTFDDALPKGAMRAGGLFVHICAGLAILGLLLARLLWRLADPPPQRESTLPGAWFEHIARLTHYALYALLFAVPSEARKLSMQAFQILSLKYLYLRRGFGFGGVIGACSILVTRRSCSLRQTEVFAVYPMCGVFATYKCSMSGIA